MKIRWASMKKYRKFAITTAIFLALVWGAAFKLDVLSTMMVCFLASIFFLAGFIWAAVKLITRKEIKYNLIIMGACVLLTFSLIIPPLAANHGLNELTAKRKVILQELRPAFIQYRQDNGTYPSALEDLAPKYIPEIPPELVNDGHDDPYKKIFYALQGEEEALFIFHTVRGPDSAAIYNVHKNSFWYDR